MDYKQAHEILKNRLSTFTDHELHDVRWFLSAKAARTASLDGEFTADELEAIALWLRNPEGVINS